MSAPEVTVIIPAYNAERYIGEALASVRGQLHNAEVLLVDDGSKDGTIRVAEGFAEGLNLTVLQQANAGPSAARNIGIQKARGRYCAFLDADDLMLPGRLATQAKLLDEQPDVGLVHTDLMTFDDDGIIHRTRRAFSDPRGGMVLERLLLDNFITTSTVMARKECLLEAGLFNVNRPISHDFELWLRIAERWKVGYIDRPLVKYRSVPGSVSDNKLATAHDALDVIEAFWEEHPDLRKSQPRLYRDSLAEHLTSVGVAAYLKGRRPRAVSYLVRSLGVDPRRPRSWKSLVKALVRPVPAARVRSREGSTGPA
jgi:glycosyltransferase involved in cell wall biosynthesis